MQYTSMPDLPAFTVVKPQGGYKLGDLTLPDGTPMIGPGGLLIPPARQFSMIVNAANRAYSYRFDEAMRDSWVNARAMLRDTFIRRLLTERMYPTVNRKWQLKVPDDRDPAQAEVRDGLTRIVKRIRDFDQFKWSLMMGSWFGRAGAQWAMLRDPELDNMWRIGKWDSIHGDTIQFDFDGNPAILMDSTTVGWYVDHGAKVGPGGDIVPTDRGGMALLLKRPYWRERFAIYRHILEKADFFEGELAGSVQGLGIRGLIYYQYAIRTDCLAWMLTYMQSVGAMDVMIFNYPAGNNQARLEQEENAKKMVGKIYFLCPRAKEGTYPPVEQLSMNSEGLKALQNLVAEYFDKQIEHCVVGQSMSTGADTDGSLGGSGKAEFAKATKDEIIQFDTNRLDSTMTWEVLPQLKKYNYPWARGFDVEFQSVMPDIERKDNVEAATKLVGLGVPLKIDEVREKANFSRPEQGDETVGSPQMPGIGMPPGTNPNAPLHVKDFGNPSMPGFGGAMLNGNPQGGNGLSVGSGARAGAPQHPPTMNDGGYGGATYIPAFATHDDWRRVAGMRRVHHNYSSDPRLFTRYGIEQDRPLTDEEIAGQLSNLVTALNGSFGLRGSGNTEAILAAIRERRGSGTPYYNPSQARATDGRFGNQAGSHPGARRDSPQAPDTRLRPVAEVPDREPTEADVLAGAITENEEPGIASRVRGAMSKVKATVYNWAVNASPYIMPVAEQIFDTPADYRKFGFAPTVSGIHGSGAGDAVKGATGISTHLAISIASRVMAYAIVKTKRRLGYQQTAPVVFYPRFQPVYYGVGYGYNPNQSRDDIGRFGSGGGGTHAINLPQNRRKVNIDQAAQALGQMGYKLGNARTDLRTKTTVYEVIKPDGTKTTASTDEILETIYRGKGY